MIDLVVNADDFGYSEEVNSAIVESANQGLLSSTTLMVNMPGFDDAVMRIKNGELKDKIRVGLHLNLFEGVPLSEGMKKCKVFCDGNGIYHEQAISFSAPRKIIGTIVTTELDEQIKKILSAGIVPSHLDSHAHRHTNWFIGSAVMKLAKKYGIPEIRQNGNIGHRKIKSKILIMLYNTRLGKFRKTDFFGNIPEMTELLKTCNTGVAEIMCHPGYYHGEILDREFKLPLADMLTPLLKSTNKVIF